MVSQKEGMLPVKTKVSLEEVKAGKVSNVVRMFKRWTTKVRRWYRSSGPQSHGTKIYYE